MRSDQSANHRRDTGGKMELYSTGYCRVRGMQLKISTRDEEEEEEKHQVYCYHQYINLDQPMKIISTGFWVAQISAQLMMADFLKRENRVENEKK